MEVALKIIFQKLNARKWTVKLFTCRRIHDNGNSVTIKVGGMFLTR
jgi:hypothetical protein